MHRTSRQRAPTGGLRHLLAACLLAWAAPLAAAPFAYVTNQGSDTVSVVDTDTASVVETVPVGAKPAGVAVAPDGRRIYVSNP